MLFFDLQKSIDTQHDARMISLWADMRFSRRTSLKAAIAFTGMLVLYPFRNAAGSTGRFAPDVLERRQTILASFREALRRMQGQSRLPIIDIEHHWSGKIPVKELIEKMDRNGVALTWLGPNERNGSQSSIEVCRQFPDRLVPTTIHGDGPRWHGKDLTVVHELHADVLSGQYFSMGEFEARHYVSSTNNRDIHMPLDSESFHGVFKAAEETGIPFLLHHEAEDALLPELEIMLSLYPRATVVWCHVGRNRNPKTWTEFPTVEGVRKFINKYPNLHFDIVQGGAKSVFPPTGAWDTILYWGREPAALRAEWIQLFNEFPDRFLIGSDINTGRWQNYDKAMQRFRMSVLEVLDPVAAEKIAYKNAWRLMSGEDWTL